MCHLPSPLYSIPNISKKVEVKKKSHFTSLDGQITPQLPKFKFNIQNLDKLFEHKCNNTTAGIIKGSLHNVTLTQHPTELGVGAAPQYSGF